MKMDTVMVTEAWSQGAPEGQSSPLWFAGLYFDTSTVYNTLVWYLETLSPAIPSSLAKLTQIGHLPVHFPSTPHLIFC